MSPNRKADLQRKLAMAPIPKPPAGLAERIKSEIPQHLLVDARKERERLSRSVAFNIRVAASIILLVGSVYLALHVLSRLEHEQLASEAPANVVVAQKQPAPAAARARVADAAPQPIESPKSAVVPKTERAVPPVGRTAPPAAPVVAAAPPPPAPIPPPVVPSEPSTAVASAPAIASEGVAAGAAPAPRAAAAKVSGGFVPAANAAEIAAPSTLFDITIPRAGAPLEGHALIQHFAAAPPPHALRVDAEATTLDGKTLLRFSVDTPEVAHVGAPIGADASLDLVFDEDAVTERHALTGDTHATQRALPSATSVTALYEVELKPGLGRRATIATVTLRYRSVADGKQHVVTRKLRRGDLRAWDDASTRMKSTALGAALVYGFESNEMIAEKARAAGLDELARVAER